MNKHVMPTLNRRAFVIGTAAVGVGLEPEQAAVDRVHLAEVGATGDVGGRVDVAADALPLSKPNNSASATAPRPQAVCSRKRRRRRIARVCCGVMVK